MLCSKLFSVAQYLQVWLLSFTSATDPLLIYCIIYVFMTTVETTDTADVQLDRIDRIF